MKLLLLPLLLVLLAACMMAAEPTGAVPAGLRLSGRLTAQGTPEVRMWAAGMPQAGVAGAGFPILANARHALVFGDAVTAGGYNHHAQLAHHGGRFYAAWSNHPKGEDAAGQRVLYASSDDGAAWRPWGEAFPPPSPVRGWGEGFGAYAVAGPWQVVAGELYLTARLYDFVGWENADRTSRRADHDAEHPFQRYEFLGFAARSLAADGALGPILALSPALDRVEGPAYASVPSSAPAARAVAGAIAAAAAGIPRIAGRLPEPVDDARLVEPAVHAAADGAWVAIIRDDKFSHRKYVSVSTDGGAGWSRAQPTDIPDSPSLDASLRAPDGSVLLVGNHCATAFDNPRDPRRPQNNHHYDRDTLDVAVSRDGYLFTRAFALRTGIQEWRVPRTVVRGRGGGPQYPAPLIVGDRLFVLYSFGKEDVWCSSVPLADLLPADLPPGR